MRFAFLILVVVVDLGVLGAMHFAPELKYRIKLDQINAEQGNAFTVGVPPQTAKVFRIKGDFVDGNQAALKLFEDGVLLGPRQASHDVIRSVGKGGYNHWANTLWFSTPDGSDPRTNGRIYTVQVQSFLPPSYVRIATIASLVVLLVYLRDRTNEFSLVVTGFLRRTFTPVPRISWKWVVFFGFVAIFTSVSLVFLLWSGPSSQGLHIAGYLPVSDALGYQHCATSLAAGAELFDPVFCSRRILHPVLLATTFIFSNWYGQVALLILAAFAGLAVLSIGIEAARTMGKIPALVVVALLGIFAWEFVLAQFMTEVTGFVLGTTGIALLVSYTSIKKTPFLLLGMALISIGLTARAGALLLLPCLFFWAIYATNDGSLINSVKRAVPISFALLCGPILQVTILAGLGLEVGNSGGNFAVVLYGHSTGTRDWSEAYRTFPELFQRGEADAFRAIYESALANILNSPDVLLRALYEVARAYVSNLFTFGIVQGLNDALSLLLVIGIVVCAFRQHESLLYSLLITLAVGELLSAPWVYGGAGHRVFSATIGARVLLGVLGLQALVGAVTKWVTGVRLEKNVVVEQAPILPVALGGCMIAGMLLPFTFLSDVVRLKPVAEIGCGTGENELLARLDRESQTIGVVAEEEEESFIPFRILRERLIADKGLSLSWWEQDVLDLPKEALIIRVFQRNRENYGTYQYVVWSGEAKDLGTGLVSICVDTSQYVSIADVPHFKAVSITPLYNGK